MKQKKIYLFSTTSHPEAIHIPSLEIEYFTPKIDFFKYDYLILTSKQAVKALDHYNLPREKLPQALCVSEKTAQAYERIGGTVLATANGYGKNIPEVMKNYEKSAQWLYLRAEEIAYDFISIASADGYNIEDMILYKTDCSKNIKDTAVESDAVLIFTSPSSVNCFFEGHKFENDQKIIVIGKTTAKVLPEGVVYHIPDTQTIESCIGLAKRYV